MKDTTHASSPSAGDVLIAHPSMPPNPFAGTLVLLYEHTDEGSLGLILNRPTGQNLSGMLKDAEMPKPFHDIPLYYGGPVQTDQFLLTLFRRDPGTHGFRCEVNPELEQLESALQDSHATLRAFVGYAGWTEGQLEEELSRNDWLWTGADEVMVAPQPTPNLWHLLAQGDYRWHSLRDRLPDHPERN
jgi:putative transcriptional regulator